ncbi:2',5'-phosphodiesterase 12 isoform X1 [Drosophila pseudoobscura]|uniref:2',5'-phosphodiesterase 12 n=2 Tax=Drosophila pseudoobscura pseudoobscura TaxID=46245 RepID=A0A6I8W5C1_DROPS|nr:2',5'-phosphodiesterase 12 isoform X1 [Drosophila pseudoobscura]
MFLPSVSVLLKFTLNIITNSRRITMDINKVYIRYVEVTDEINIVFRYVNQELNVDRDFSFCRKKGEPVFKLLVRIRSNVEKELEKSLNKSSKRGSTAEQNSRALPEVKIEMYRDRCDSSFHQITLAELLQDNFTGVKLRVIDQIFDIVLNQPWVDLLKLPKCILAGCLIYPSKLHIQFAVREHCYGMWFKSTQRDAKTANWEKCGEGLTYQIAKKDVGYYIKFAVIPRNKQGISGPMAEEISKCVVQAGPDFFPFQMRQRHTANLLSEPSHFRVVTYNILADLYADSEYSRQTLFPYCSRQSLLTDYRKQLLIKELIGYNADLICLQEVDQKIFDVDFKNVLEMPPHNFYGMMAPKGTCTEGVSVFYRRSRYDLLGYHVLHLGNSIPALPIFEPLWNKIKTNKKLAARICNRSTTLQICLLKVKKTDKYLLVANTHLYFHPDADHIRLLQIGFALTYIEYLHKQSVKEHNITDPQNIGLIFCGDFNSVPDCGVYKLMTEQFVDKQFSDWCSNPDEAVVDVELAQPFKMFSACGKPRYTNYTALFSGCLDYIFCQQDRFELLQCLPLPTEEQLTAHTAIPSICFPSDHIALVADLSFESVS